MQDKATVAVIGLGYVGIPLAQAAAQAGFVVWGIDIDPQKVSSLGEGSAFSVTSDMGAIATCSVIIICVPTPLKHQQPDTSHVERAARDIARNLRPGALVVLESTSYPGTTEELLLPILESSGLKAGIDFHLGFSPERIDPGNERFDLSNVPKIVGGIDQASTDRMKEFYSAFVEEVIPVSSPRTAEMTKLLENTYRHVNIALANEMAILCHDLGIDVWEVIDAASTKPFGFHPFYPGPGWGGHCIPVDPAYLSWRVRQMGATAHFVELAREFNQKMPSYIVQRVQEALEGAGKALKGAHILVLGVTYKPGVADTRESPALKIIDRLQKAGAVVAFNDPHRSSLVVGRRTLHGASLDELGAYDLVLIHTDHPEYDWKVVAASARLVLDTRNALKGVPAPHIIRL